jgi:hypothetical protein
MAAAAGNSTPGKRRLVSAVAAGMALVVAAPVAAAVYSLTGAPRPPHTQFVFLDGKADWSSQDGVSRVRMNRFNIAALDNVLGVDERGRPGPRLQSGKGPVIEWRLDGFSVLLLPSFSTVSLSVESWPEDQAKGVFVVDGRPFTWTDPTVRAQ